MSHIAQALESVRQRRGNDVILCCHNDTVTGNILYRNVYAMGSILRRNGVCCGDRVAIASVNGQAYLECLLSLTSIGAIAVLMNYRWGAKDAARAINEVECSRIIMDEHCVGWWPSISSDCPSLKCGLTVSCHGHPNSTESNIEPQQAYPPPSVSLLSLSAMVERYLQALTDGPLPFSLPLISAPQDIAVICFTSGSTGSPKPAALSHSALVLQSMAKMAAVGYSSSDVYLHCAPLCHVGGLSSALAVLLAGGRHVMLPRFSVPAVVSALVAQSVTSFIAVPAMLQDILIDQSQPPYTAVTRILVGGGSPPPRLLSQLQGVFPSARLSLAYGMTEATSSITFLQLPLPFTDPPEQQRGGSSSHSCVGFPAPHVAIRICQLASDEAGDAALGEMGEVCTRGPHLMVKYWGQAPSRDPWFHTGDLGYLDASGRLWLCGRLSDSVRTGGETVQPLEVESVCCLHPGVEAVTVVGVPHGRLGDTVAALLRMAPGWRWKDGPESRAEKVLCLKDLQMFCVEKGLARYKLPRVAVPFSGPWPVTDTGKVRRGLVRDIVMAKGGLGGSAGPHHSKL